MDQHTSEAAIKTFIGQILVRLEEAAVIAKAAQTCAESGSVGKAVQIALDIEQPIHEATTLLNAAGLISRLDET